MVRAVALSGCRLAIEGHRGSRSRRTRMIFQEIGFGHDLSVSARPSSGGVVMNKLGIDRRNRHNEGAQGQVRPTPLTTTTAVVPRVGGARAFRRVRGVR